MGKLSRAEARYTEAVKVSEKILGMNHPDYAESLKNLAGLYYVMGESDKADSLREKASKIGHLGELGPPGDPLRNAKSQNSR